MRIGGQNYLIPVNARIDQEQDVEFEAMAVGRVLAEMDAAENRLDIVILDACRHNPFTRSWRPSTQGLARAMRPRAR